MENVCVPRKINAVSHFGERGKLKIQMFPQWINLVLKLAVGGINVCTCVHTSLNINYIKLSIDYILEFASRLG